MICSVNSPVCEPVGYNINKYAELSCRELRHFFHIYCFLCRHAIKRLACFYLLLYF